MRKASVIYIRDFGGGSRIWNSSRNLFPQRDPGLSRDRIYIKPKNCERQSLVVKAASSEKEMPIPSFLFMKETVQTELLVQLSLKRKARILAHLPGENRHVRNFDLQLSPDFDKFGRSAVKFPFVADSFGRFSFRGTTPDTILSTVSFQKIIEGLVDSRKRHLATAIFQRNSSISFTLMPKLGNLGLAFLPEHKIDLFSRRTLEYISLLYKFYPRSMEQEANNTLTKLFESANGPLSLSLEMNMINLAVGYNSRGTIVGSIIV